mmetsp:Transcript_21941/g.37471  ORF Transcript_21941/g.37471 Transcript_21941/m.37471 type:complete len:293 (+) Transcript_21941:24-902(+)
MSAERKRARPSNEGVAEVDDELGSAVDDSAFDAANQLRNTMDNAASEFLCPITCELPVDPVTAMDGKVYERKAIEKWIRRGNGKSPITNLPMSPTLLPALHVRNSLELMVKSGAITGDKVDAWRKKIENENYAEEVRASAVAGDPVAACKLGRLLLLGRDGLKRNSIEAFAWFQKSAEGGCAGGLCQVGISYLRGTGVVQNVHVGLVTITEAALMGDEVAAWSLGFLFDGGWVGSNPMLLPPAPVLRDVKAAAKWYRKLTETSTSSALPLDASRKQDALAWLARYDAEQQQR